MGHPISHSTHSGFRAPPATALRGLEFLLSWLGAPLFLASWQVGVGNLSIIAHSAGFGALLPSLNRFDRGFIVAVGVPHHVFCENPDAVAFVGSTEVGSSQHEPCSMIPAFGQVPENDMYSTRGKEWGILHEREAGSNFANNAVHVRPETGAGAGDASSLASAGDVLAREASGNDVDNASPGCAVKGCDVIPDWELGQDAVSLTLEEDISRVSFNFARADRSPAK